MQGPKKLSAPLRSMYEFIHFGFQSFSMVFFFKATSLFFVSPNVGKNHCNLQYCYSASQIFVLLTKIGSFK